MKTGEKIGKWLSKNGENINIYNAPILKIEIPEAFLGLVIRRFIGKNVK